VGFVQPRIGSNLPGMVNQKVVPSLPQRICRKRTSVDGAMLGSCLRTAEFATGVDAWLSYVTDGVHDSRAKSQFARAWEQRPVARSGGQRLRGMFAKAFRVTTNCSSSNEHHSRKGSHFFFFETQRLSEHGGVVMIPLATDLPTYRANSDASEKQTLHCVADLVSSLLKAQTFKHTTVHTPFSRQVRTSWN
jgi:hypothetical protein